MLVLVTSIDQVIENIRSYQTAVRHSGKARPTGVKHWYYLPSKDIAGPSRFIGYQNMTAEMYDNERPHGWRTWGAIKQLGKFKEISSGEAYEKAYAAAERLLPVGKRLRSNAKFHVLASD